MNIFEVLIVQPLFNLLMLLYVVIPGANFGLSIIVFTILLRLAIHPLVKRQLHQTKAMRKLQPELEAIKRRTKGNRQQQGIEMMELYKRHDVSPFRSFGIILVQLPIFIALYIVIQIFALHPDEIGKWTYNFLEGIPAIQNIVNNPSAFNPTLFGFIDLTQHAISANGVNIALLILAIIAAIGQFYQSKQTLPQSSSQRRLRDILKEASEGKEADQSEINNAIMGKMIYILPVFMLFVMLSLPGAIALYYATSTIVAVIQQGIILREDEEELEEIASERTPKKPGKKATVKAQARVDAAQEATVTRVVAKSSHKSKPKKKSQGGSK